ncbi:MAG: ATP-binding cassette domain-containing protein, partial [Dehalococcoidia bacterium]
MNLQSRPLEVRNLVKSFGRPSRFTLKRRGAETKPPPRALDGISFSVERGEIFGIIGANGSGKSTLIRIISTLLLPDEGSVEVFGADVARDAAAVRPLINRVSVDPSFFKNMSSLENLLFFGRIYGLSKAEVMTKAPEILERLGFESSRMRQAMSDLSRGQQQKVALARSFLTS